MSRPYADNKILPFPEIVTRQFRLSPSDDFKLRTLSALRGLWSKLLYISELRLPDGKYDHWGHIRMHGERRSQEAIAEVHSEIYLDLLRTPLRQSVREISEEGRGDCKDRIDRIRDNAPKMIPENPRGGSPRHFNSIALAAYLLDADREAYRRQGA